MNNTVQKTIDDEDNMGFKVTSEIEVRKLQDEVNTLRKKSLGLYVIVFEFLEIFISFKQIFKSQFFFLELEKELQKHRSDHRRILTAKQDLESIQDEKLTKIKELEKNVKLLKVEKEDLHKVRMHKFLSIAFLNFSLFCKFLAVNLNFSYDFLKLLTMFQWTVFSLAVLKYL